MKEQCPKNVKDAIKHLYTITKANKAAEKEFVSDRKSTMKEILAFLDKNGANDISFEISSRLGMKLVTASKRVSRTISYDAVLLEKKLGKETCLEFVDREYIINDFDGLVRYLKSCGVNPQKFKSFIRCDKTVNKAKLEQQFQLGEITLEDIEDCYSVKESTPYVDVKVKDIFVEE